MKIISTGKLGHGFVTGYEVLNQSGERVGWFGVKNPHSRFRRTSQAIALLRARRKAEAMKKEGGL